MKKKVYFSRKMDPDSFSPEPFGFIVITPHGPVTPEYVTRIFNERDMLLTAIKRMARNRMLDGSPCYCDSSTRKIEYHSSVCQWLKGIEGIGR